MNKENPDVQGLVESAKTQINDFSGFLTYNLDLLADFNNSQDVENMIKRYGQRTVQAGFFPMSYQL